MNAKLAPGLAALGLAAGNVFAQSSDWSGPMARDFWGYIGASAGQSKFRTDCASFFDCKRTDTGFKIYGGGQFSDIVGLELGYTDFGKVNASGGDTEAWAVPLSLTVGVPLGDRFRIFVKGGGLYGRTDVRASAASLIDSGHKNGWGTTWGAGAALGISKSVQLRVDWDRYNLDFVGGNRDVDMLSGGVQMRF
jgi:OmpA-OmpF porin, OOP family